MRTLSLGSSSARLSSSSTTSQFSSPHLAKGKALRPRRPHAAPGAGRERAALLPGSVSALEIQAKVARGVRRAQAGSSKPPQCSPPGPAAPTVPGSVRLGHLLLDKALCFLPGEEDPGTAGQRRHQAHLPHAVTQAVSVHPAQGDASVGTGASPAPSWGPSADPQHPPAGRGSLPNQLPCPSSSAHPRAARAGRPSIPGGIQLSSARGLRINGVENKGTVPGDEGSISEGPGGRGAPSQPRSHLSATWLSSRLAPEWLSLPDLLQESEVRLNSPFPCEESWELCPLSASSQPPPASPGWCLTAGTAAVRC